MYMHIEYDATQNQIFVARLGKVRSGRAEVTSVCVRDCAYSLCVHEFEWFLLQLVATKWLKLRSML